MRRSGLAPKPGDLQARGALLTNLPPLIRCSGNRVPPCSSSSADLAQIPAMRAACPRQVVLFSRRIEPVETKFCDSASEEFCRQSEHYQSARAKRVAAFQELAALLNDSFV
jgi:hypothetical protein